MDKFESDLQEFLEGIDLIATPNPVKDISITNQPNPIKDIDFERIDQICTQRLQAPDFAQPQIDPESGGNGLVIIGVFLVFLGLYIGACAVGVHL
ncbi:hypothetical protein [Aquirhabdus parva]|uniref:Uncharacterized protein n=1 Tax=Aquirhabdus parva TaxID=2283318 RepID=A0A345PAT9_9GAMM|nr:hypothetical protein [Aquirhabdus parva]AXI04354.1 hypothetical protein HYN46_16835 [Aquirhabdus parva]AXI04398.1 hypothetical protein HYN46_17080 [Aquirhabdus parva]